MSITASIFVLFESAPSDARLLSIEEIISNRTRRPVERRPRQNYGRFLPVPDADLHAFVSPDGFLEWVDEARLGPLSNAVSLEGRLFQNATLSRWWSEDYAEGPMLEFATIMLCLLAQPDVRGVWYTDDSRLEGRAVLPPQNRDSVHRLIDSFIMVGETLGGKPTKYIRTDSGAVIGAN